MRTPRRPNAALASERADAGPAPEVAEALARVSALVARKASGWSVGGVPAGASVDSLADGLYTQWYTRPAAPPPAANGDPRLFRHMLLSSLRAADVRATTFTGWTATGTDPRGVVSAVKGDRVRVLRPGEYIMSVRPGAPPAPGEPVESVARLDHLDADAGIWWAFTDPPPAPPLGRVYLDVRPATAARAVRELTTAVDGLAYQFKCPVVATALERVDAIVLYHERPARANVLAALIGRWPTLGGLLDPAVPPLTCLVRPGLSWADDVDDQRSYGENRCYAIAAAIDRAAATWAGMAASERVGLLLDELRAQGIDPQRPWEAPA
jgi:hypothetical protein